MSGLIWAGIGKGIADAGQSFASAGMKQLEMDRQDEREALREERLLKRQEALDELKAERERTREEQLQQRVIKESAAVGTKANEIATTREGRAFDKLAESSAAAGEQGDIPLSKEQLQKLAKDNPALGEQYKKMGLIESSMPLTANQKRIQRADDEVQASIDIGAHSSVQKSLLEKRKAVLDEIKEENKETERKADRELENRREDRRAKEFQALLPLRQQQADASTTKAGAAVTSANRPVSGASDPNKPATTADLSRQVTAAKNLLATELGVATKDIEGEIKSIRKRADAGNAGAKATLERLQPMIGEYNEANQRMLNFKRSSPATSNSRDNSNTRPPLSSFAR